MTAPTVRACACCTRDTTAFVCFACAISHGRRVYRDCTIADAEEKARAERIKALPPQKPLVVSKAMHNRVMGLDS